MQKDKIAKILNSVEETVKRYTAGSLKDDGHFVCTLKAGLAKNYELTRLNFDTVNRTNCQGSGHRKQKRLKTSETR